MGYHEKPNLRSIRIDVEESQVSSISQIFKKIIEETSPQTKERYTPTDTGNIENTKTRLENPQGISELKH